jgi:putative cell wall-binding protein
MMGFATRGGSTDPATTRAQVNQVDLKVQGASSWEGRVYDVTAATTREAGWINPWFEQRLVGSTTRSWDLDNLQIYTCRTAPVSRIGGADRYQVSANVAAGYATGRPVVFLVTGTVFSDALGGAALAGSLDAPVLLTRPGSLPETVRAQLQRLAPQQVVILGGTTSVSDTVAGQAAGYADEVTRIGGADRYAVSAAVVGAYYGPGVDVLYLASGEKFPDALSISPLAAHQGAPLLLTRPDRLDPAAVEQVQRLAPGRIVVVGGPATVSDSVLTALREVTDAPVSRITGANRYEVSSSVAAQFPTGGERAYLASGENYPDALVGGAVAGMRGVPVLLTRPTSLTTIIGQRLSSLQVDSAQLLGGHMSLSALVMDQAGARVG